MADVRKKESERVAETQIDFAFEKEMLDKDRLRELFVEEIQYYKKLRESSS